jgi:hypothetical protein
VNKKWKNAAERTAAYRERLAQKQEAADEAASEEAQAEALDLRFFGESAYNRNAESAQDEIHIHRQFLRALDQPDVLSNETLRELAKRVWGALLNADGIGISKWPDHLRAKYQSGYDVWFPYFDPALQDFHGWFGVAIHGAARPDFHDAHWIPPNDCRGDEPIDLKSLPPLPPMRKVRNFKPQSLLPQPSQRSGMG